MTLVRIETPDDPRLAPYRDLRDAGVTVRYDGFIVEGEVALRRAITAGRFPLGSALVSEKRLDRLSDLLVRLPEDAPAYVAPQGLMDAVVGFSIHRGVLAFGRRTPGPNARSLLAGLPARTVALGLVGIGDADNMGAIFRNAAAFGAGAVVLDATSCDPLYRKAIRTSVGASLTVPFARLAPEADMVALFEACGFDPLALSPAGAEPLSGLAPPRRAALLLGSEGPGLPPAILSRARTVAIPMAAGFDSLNVATAGAVALHHLTRG